MADNFAFNPTGSATGASDVIGTVHYPRVKVVWGVDGTVVDASATDPLPVVPSATKVDDAAFTPGTSSVIVIGAEADEAAPDSVDEGDAGALRMTLARGLHVNIRDASGTEVDLTAAVPITDNSGSLTVDGTVSITDISNAEYEMVAASQTAQVLGATGATGDYVSHLTVVPATTSPGQVLLLDNATSITVFTGGTVSDVKPFTIYLGMKSVSGAWKVTTGSSVSVVGVGNFT